MIIMDLISKEICSHLIPVKHGLFQNLQYLLAVLNSYPKTHHVTVWKVIAFDRADSFPLVLTGQEVLYAYWDQKTILY
jgi:hypothetical protein